MSRGTWRLGGVGLCRGGGGGGGGDKGGDKGGKKGGKKGFNDGGRGTRGRKQ